MKKLGILIGLAVALPAASANAHDTATAFPSRGACEAASAAMSINEQDFLLEAFPDLFDTPGEASSFLTKAWTCDRSEVDGQFYMTDHIEEVLASQWYARRNH